MRPEITCSGTLTEKSKREKGDLHEQRARERVLFVWVPFFSFVFFLCYCSCCCCVLLLLCLVRAHTHKYTHTQVHAQVHTHTSTSAVCACACVVVVVEKGKRTTATAPQNTAEMVQHTAKVKGDLHRTHTAENTRRTYVLVSLYCVLVWVPFFSFLIVVGGSGKHVFTPLGTTILG